MGHTYFNKFEGAAYFVFGGRLSQTQKLLALNHSQNLPANKEKKENDSQELLPQSHVRRFPQLPRFGIAHGL